MLPLVLAAALLAAPPSTKPIADDTLAADIAGQIDAAARDVIAEDGTPSVSVAIVLHGRLTYAKAYGLASLSPRTIATADTRYQLASASKSTTAQALLLLAADGRLSLDSPIARWLPQVSGSDRITVRELLGHRSGLPDHYPQSYPAGPRGQPTTPDRIIAEWGRHPLLFAPGTQFRYSNLNYEIAGRIAELVSGEPLFAWQREHIFVPLGMTHAVDLDQLTSTTPDIATGYVRVGLAPLEPAPTEGPGWSFGAGQIVATATDLARWDVGLLSGKLLPVARVHEDMTAPLLADGSRSPYALGMFVSEKSGRLVWSHVGQGLGFLAENSIFPSDDAAIVVLTNTSTTQSFSKLSDRLAFLLLPATRADSQARALFAALQGGRLDRATLTPEFSDYLNPQRIEAYRNSLGSLGGLTSLVLKGEDKADGVITRRYEASVRGRRLAILWEQGVDGRTDDFTVQASPD